MDSIKVLLADDHPIVRAGLHEALASLPELVITGEVGNGTELMRALETLNPDLLVVDVAMPDFEPVAAAHQIRAAYPNLKILVVSAYDDQAYVVGLLSAGVDGYHLKDQPLSDLQLAVRRIMAGDRWISSPLVNRLVTSGDDSAPSPTRRQRELLRLLDEEGVVDEEDQAIAVIRKRPRVEDVIRVAAAAANGAGPAASRARGGPRKRIRSRVLRALSGDETEQFLDQLDDAERAGVIGPSPWVPRRYRFLHPLIRDAVRHTLAEKAPISVRARRVPASADRNSREAE